MQKEGEWGIDGGAEFRRDLAQLRDQMHTLANRVNTLRLIVQDVCDAVAAPDLAISREAKITAEGIPAEEAVGMPPFSRTATQAWYWRRAKMLLDQASHDNPAWEYWEKVGFVHSGSLVIPSAHIQADIVHQLGSDFAPYHFLYDVLSLQDLVLMVPSYGASEATQYFYEEHTCPTNVMKGVAEVLRHQGTGERFEWDPHDVFKYLGTIAVPAEQGDDPEEFPNLDSGQLLDLHTWLHSRIQEADNADNA